ncbi:MAG: adenine phosphoribosyltransferase [Candidatus Dormibacteraceae bacterium]
MTIDLERLIPTVADFPVPGVLFRDITPLLADHEGFQEAVRRMCEPWRGERVELITAMEARGFMFAAPMALELGCGFVPMRKAGKLPRRTRSVQYALEYRKDTLHIHEDAIRPGQRVLIVDDVLASGGTAAAVVELLTEMKADILGLEFLIELRDLGGRSLLGTHRIHSEITF